MKTTPSVAPTLRPEVAAVSTGVAKVHAPSRPFWSLPSAELLSSLRATQQGLAGSDARQRLTSGGAQARRGKGKSSVLMLLVSQFKSPIILILLFAVGLSFLLHDITNAIIILAIVLMSGLLGFWQEHGAADAVAKLLAIIQITATLLRDGKPTEVSIEEIVPGDIVLLKAGDIIPGDSLLLESNSLFVNEAALTGETFPVEKIAGVLPAETPLGKRTNSLFTGTYAVSGTGTALVVKTGKETEFGQVSESLKQKPPETDFERGIRRFGYLLMEVTLLMVLSIFAINVYLHHPVLQSFLFALALAVGLTPQLLPAIISVNLAHGAKRMAAAKVIVKRLAAIENFGSMDVLCSDKTGTLTLGEVQLDAAADVDGKASAKTLLYAQLNASFQTGYANPIDAAILAYRPLALSAYKKLDEEPYDFVRKRLSILVTQGETRLMVTKGAVANILEVCTTAETAAGDIVPLEALQEQIQKQVAAFCAQGFRVVGVAYRGAELQAGIGKVDEKAMTFLGFLALFDPIKPGTVEIVQTLRKLGISLKIITGDNRLVAAHVSREAGLTNTDILTGPELREMSHAALRQRVNSVDVFAEIEPNQKEALIVALKQAGHVVGYIGDGINDASALHVADVGISVANAVDVAKEAADIVLLEKDLAVLENGVREGRITFANTLKYVFMATSANFGNMFSMAGASLMLPFLPLLPTQILLMNLMTDFPEMTIATNSVDPEMVEKPRRWDIGFIRRFMIVFGLVSSVCDYLTFGVLRLLLHANTREFRTGWFMESVVSAALIVLVIRTRKPFYRSRPANSLLIATAAIIAATLLLPYLPFAGIFGFTPVPPLFLLVLALILAFYITLAEVTKFFFYRHEDKQTVRQSSRV
jgi:Mg2+-importing ATPase